MRGEERRQGAMLLAIDPEKRVGERSSAATDQTLGAGG